MPDDTFELSRRKALAGLGTIGIASAGAGLGTSAFFSDREEFTGNRLVAGELDLKVDWTEHYSDWSDDEKAGIDTVSMSPGTDSGGEPLFGFPSSAPEMDKSVYVSDAQQFMMNTAIEAFPDVLDPATETYDAMQVRIDDDICDLPADLDEDLSDGTRDGVLASDLRTRGTFPPSGAGNAQTTNPGDPLINITDVKPGDFGEVTFSFHLCGNPGYVWLTGELVDADENRPNPEPEDADEDEFGPDGTNVNGDPDPNAGNLFANEGDEDANGTIQERVELLDEMRASVWYDTGLDGIYGADLTDDGDGETVKDEGEGDNIFQSAEERILPLNGSLRSVLRALGNNLFPLVPAPAMDGGGGIVGGGGGGGGGGTTVSGDGSSLASQVINTGTSSYFENKAGKNTARNWQCADYAERIPGVENIVGQEFFDTEDAPLKEGSLFVGCTTVEVNAVASDGSGDVTLSSSSPVKIVSVKGGDSGENVYVFDTPVILDEVTFTTPGDHDISNIDVCCPDNGDPQVPPTDIPVPRCFPNSTTAYIGFEWWLPVDHANEIQGDSVSFDLGFYTEQCRHNDGTNPQPDGILDVGDFSMDLSTGVADWTVVSSPDGTTGDAVTGGKNPAWASVTDPECDAEWIDPYGNSPTDSDPVGGYVYELEFEVPASSSPDLVVTAFGSDNPGRLFLDGTEIKSHLTSTAFDPLDTTTVTVDDLSVGTHTLTAEVENQSGGGQNPTGLLVCASLV